MEISGKVIAVLPLETGTSKSGNSWQKRNFVIETGGQYPKKAIFQLFGDKVNDCPQVGEEVKVSFDIDSHDWTNQTTGKTTWFTQLNAWKVERQAGAQTQPVQQAQSEPQKGDDLPF